MHKSSSVGRRRWSERFGIAVPIVVRLLQSACERRAAESRSFGKPAEARGNSIISAASSTNAARPITNASFIPADFSKPDRLENGIIQLGWDKLSGFKFDV